MFNETTTRPTPGQCWMCNRRDTVPAERRTLIPALCGTECEQGWADQYRIDGFATHTAEAEEWVPIRPFLVETARRLNEIADAARPITPKSRVVPVGPPFPGFPAVDQVVAEAGPPVTPVTPAELAARRREKPAPRPVPGGWLRRAIVEVFR